MGDGGAADGRGRGPAAGIGRAGALLLCLAGFCRPVLAQVDTTRADSTRARPDSVDAYTLLIRGEEDARTYVAVLPRPTERRLLPPLSRIVIPRDSIEVINAATLGDVLATIPGVYLWRGGWIGRPEIPTYFGRGSGSVEYDIDGVPFVPMGPDSVATDPSLLPLGLLDRIEIEQRPGRLLVHLMFRRHDVLAPLTRVAVTKGDFNQARYEGLIAKRFRSGFGFGLGVEYLLTDGPNDAAGNFSNSNAWLQAEYVPSARLGFQLQYLRGAPDRARVLTREDPADTLVRPLTGTRGDLTARLFLGGGDEAGLGRRADLVFSRSTWTSDDFEQHRWQAGLMLSQRGRTSSLEWNTFYGSRWTRLDTRVIGGWAPTGQISAGVEGAYQTYDDGRSGRWVLARGGLTLPLGLSVSGTWRVGRAVDRPSVVADSAQNLADRSLTAAWAPLPAATAEAGYVRLAAWRPAGMWSYAQVDSIAPSAPTEWLVLGGRLAPRQWLTVAGWYHHPLGRRLEGTPPTHSRIEAAIRSKFLRTFPSGIFDLKVAATVENWGAGVLGRSADGEPVTLKGATIYRGLLQMQLGGFIIYYDRANMANTDLPFVPGLPIPRNISSYGIRWVFLN